jgi:hypothetical protein
MAEQLGIGFLGDLLEDGTQDIEAGAAVGDFFAGFMSQRDRGEKGDEFPGSRPGWQRDGA